MRIVSVMNQKGGCGKTTTAVNLAASLAHLGHKTLLVDMDPQGHCAVGLAVPEEQVERSLFDVLSADGPATAADLEAIVWQIATDFDLAPSDLKLAAFEQTFAGRPGRENRLKQLLSTVAARYEWCVIDNPPGVGLLTFNSLVAADEVIVPVETGFFSLHGLTKMLETLDELKEAAGLDTQVRVLPTLYDTRTKLAREVLGEMRAKFRHRLTESTINFNTKLKEAASFGQPITEYDPGSRGFRDFANLAKELMGDRPAAEPEPAAEKMTRPQELVQRAKQLAQLTNVKFGRGAVPGVGYDLPDESANGSAAATATLAPPRTALPAALLSPPATVRTTEQKLSDFYGVRQVGDEVVFAARFADARHVMVAGDFNGWSAIGTPLAHGGVGGRADTWVTKLPLRPGKYCYRFIVDGRWVNDPYNDRVEANEFGELNNVVEVG